MDIPCVMVGGWYDGCVKKNARIMVKAARSIETLLNELLYNTCLHLG